MENQDKGQGEQIPSIILYLRLTSENNLLNDSIKGVTI